MRGAILIGIAICSLAAWGYALIAPEAAAALGITLPEGLIKFESVAPIAGKIDFSYLLHPSQLSNFIVIMLTFLFVDFFDTVGVLFLAAMFFSPVFVAIPGYATAPALIYVGYLMLSAVKDIDLADITEGLPAFVTILAMPLTYSIGDELTLGVLSYVALNLLYNLMAPTEKRKKVSIVMIVLAVLFILKLIFI